MVVVLVAAGTAAYVGSAWVRRQVDLSVTHRPEPFTALYFTHSRDLSQLVSLGQPYLVEVTVADHDGAPPHHVLVVEVSAGGLTIPVAERTFNLARNGHEDEAFDFVLPRPHVLYDLVFTLDNTEHLRWRVLST